MIWPAGRLSPAIGLVERVGGDGGRLAAALEQATPELDALSEQLLERWLMLLSGLAATGRRRLRLSA